MKKALIAIGVAVSSFGLPSMSLAADNEGLCGFYSNLGRGVVEFMLPLTVQEMVDMNSGQSPELSDRMVKNLMTYVSATELMDAAELSEKDIELLSENAGVTSMSLLMEARATSGIGIRDVMRAHCMSTGATTIIANQRAASALTEVR